MPKAGHSCLSNQTLQPLHKNVHWETVGQNWQLERSTCNCAPSCMACASALLLVLSSISRSRNVAAIALAAILLLPTSFAALQEGSHVRRGLQVSFCLLQMHCTIVLKNRHRMPQVLWSHPLDRLTTNQAHPSYKPPHHVRMGIVALADIHLQHW